MVKNENIKWIEGKLATRNLVKGQSVYGEKLVRIGDDEYRIWNPYRSKLAGAIYKGLKTFPIKIDSKILYLGAASGTTASHISDIVRKGIIYCVEFSPRVFRDLLQLCQTRKNMIPLLRDATKPETYANIVEVCDIIYEDVAQPNQIEILISNAEHFLKKNGYVMIAIKARSIDVTKRPEEIFKEELRKMSEYFEILEKIYLEPYDKDHLFVVARYK